MINTVFLNVAKLDFNNDLDFSPIDKITKFNKYNAASDIEILAVLRNQNIIITKELPLGRDLIAQFPPSVKLICEAGTGYNNIDIIAARDNNITVCNVPGYSTEAVAQLAITLVLNFSISLNQQQKMLHRGLFDNFYKQVQVPLCEIGNKTLGLIGFGAIAQQVAKIARALGMKIMASCRTPKPDIAPDIRFVRLEELLEQSDYVSIHCPLTSETKHLIDMDKLRLMKPAGVIVNTSRGPIIKESDLIDALQQGIIAGAGLDVQDPEPPEPANPLFGMDNVILTPHIGWKGIETRQRLVGGVAENIESFIKGMPINRVN